jgi:hypothetical protein
LIRNYGAEISGQGFDDRFLIAGKTWYRKDLIVIIK